MKQILRTIILSVAVSCMLPCLPATQAARPAQGVRLVVVIVIDQMRAEYFTRFQDQYTGGFRYLAARGRTYSDAHQDHSCTVTAVGHSTILTGMYPSHTGIIGNEWYDRSRRRVVTSTTAANGNGAGRESLMPTPLALRATTLGDWLVQSAPAAKVFALSRKDRAAILLGGQHPTGAYWYDPADGSFTTSEYYGNGLPGWVKAFNAQRPANKYFGRTWNRLLANSAYRRSTPDDQKGEARLAGRQTFPYRYTASRKPDSRFYSYLISTPFMDELTLALARRAVISEKLGKRGVLDLLAVSLSTTDAVGHTFGPQSQEIQDLMLRLDRMLGSFFKFLDKDVGLTRVVILLTGDHGVAPLPEVENAGGVNGRQAINLAQTAREAEAFLTRLHGSGPWLESEYSGNVYLNQRTIQAHGLPSSEVENQLAQFFRSLPFVQDAFTRTELTSGQPHSTTYASLYAHCFDPERSGDLMLQPKENLLLTSSLNGTTHGSPYQFDTHVPLVFTGPGIAPGTVSKRVRTVDIAPTLADLLGIPVSAKVDGQSILAVGQ
jgi:predicted AlkP superfamily pyrophosphatase or phosphodiesterase